MSVYTIAGQTFDTDLMQSDPPGLRDCSAADMVFFEAAIVFLPRTPSWPSVWYGADGLPMESSVGPHSVRSMRRLACEAGFKAGRLLEIGFNVGYSAATWLTLLPECTVTSVDKSRRAETQEAVATMGERFPGRFRFHAMDSAALTTHVMGGWYGLAFIDGDHSEAGIIRDVQSCLSLGVRRMVYDDWLPAYGETIAALSRFNVRRLVVAGNMALAEW